MFVAWRQRGAPEIEDHVEVEGLAALLELAGWDAERLRAIARAIPTSLAGETELGELTALLARVRLLAPFPERSWKYQSLSSDGASDNAEPTPPRSPLFPGELVTASGHVSAWQRVDRGANAGGGSEPASLYRVTVGTTAGVTAEVITEVIPRRWEQQPDVGQSVGLRGVYLGEVSNTGSPPSVGLLVPRVAWYPEVADPPRILAGHAVLATLGFDVGLLDLVQNRRSLTVQDGETFYAMLAAASRSTPGQLQRAANRQLTSFAAWVGVAESSRESDEQDRKTTEPGPASRGTQLREIATRAAEQGRYSVAPFFNEPEQHVGQLVSFTGLVRRGVRVEVAGLPPADIPQAARESGLERYYELELYTEDSQNFPIICCVGSLPAGFPLGGRLSERVTVAGFFLKAWRYRARRADLPPEEGSRAIRQQYAPLVIAPGIIRKRSAPSEKSWLGGLLSGSAFIAILAAIAWVVWRRSESDK